MLIIRFQLRDVWGQFLLLSFLSYLMIHNVNVMASVESENSYNDENIFETDQIQDLQAYLFECL